MDPNLTSFTVTTSSRVINLKFVNPLGDNKYSTLDFISEAVFVLPQRMRMLEKCVQQCDIRDNAQCRRRRLLLSSSSCLVADWLSQKSHQSCTKRNHCVTAIHIHPDHTYWRWRPMYAALPTSSYRSYLVIVPQTAAKTRDSSGSNVRRLPFRRIPANGYSTCPEICVEIDGWIHRIQCSAFEYRDFPMFAWLEVRMRL